MPENRMATFTQIDGDREAESNKGGRWSREVGHKMLEFEALTHLRSKWRSGIWTQDAGVKGPDTSKVKGEGADSKNMKIMTSKQMKIPRSEVKMLTSKK